MIRLFIALLLVSILVVIATCSKSPTQPTQHPDPFPRFSLTVKVMTQEGVPIFGAGVYFNRQWIGLTDTTGVFKFKVEPNTFVSVEIQAPGYMLMRAGGEINSDETWTFYLTEEPPVAK